MQCKLHVAGLHRCTATARPLVPAVVAGKIWRPPLGDDRRRRHSSARLAPPSAAAGPTRSGDEPLPEQPLAADSPILEVERQAERALAYTGITALLGVAGLALAVAPARVIAFVYAACPSSLVAGLARITGSLLLLAATCANCLKEAAENERLKSDTYCRLNLALVWWGLGSTLVLWLAPQQPVRPVLGLCTALLGSTAAHAALTYQETADKGFNPLYLARKFLSSLGHLCSYNNTGKGFPLSLYAYGLATKAAIAVACFAMLEGRTLLLQNGLLQAPLGALGNALVSINGMGFVLFAMVLYTLKDASARGRLGASTFKALNVGASVVAITVALNLVAGMQAGYIVGNVAAATAALSGGGAALALGNYFFAKK